MRTENSMKNILTGVIVQIISVILGFITRKVFIDNMGIDLLGINGLLSNIISMLSLVELGIGSAIFYSLYKPIAENDEEQIYAIMRLFSTVYKYIAVIIAILGIASMPLLEYFAKTTISMNYVMIIYLIFVIDAVASYVYSYRRGILAADQKSYIINKISTIYSIGINVIQMIIIIFTKNYILFLVIKIVLVIIQNIQIYNITNKKYSFLKRKLNVEVRKDIKSEIIKNTKALCIFNIGSYIVLGTDNILLSYFVGITGVGIYSNYCTITDTITSLIKKVFDGILASLGNFLLEKSNNDLYEVFNVLFFTGFWISTFCSTSLIVLLNPFIKIWLGEKLLFPLGTVIVIVYNFYIRSMNNSIQVIRSASGLFNPYKLFKYWSLVEGVVNLIASILLAGPLKMGALGIFIGTTISSVVKLVTLPSSVYKYVFNKSPKEYYIKYLFFTIFSLIVAVITFKLSNIIVFNNLFVDFIIKASFCVIIPNVLIAVIFRKSNEVKYLINKVNIISKLKNLINNNYKLH